MLKMTWLNDLKIQFMEKSFVFKVTLHQLVFRRANLISNIKVELWHFESSEVIQFSQKLDFTMGLLTQT